MYGEAQTPFAKRLRLTSSTAVNDYDAPRMNSNTNSDPQSNNRPIKRPIKPLTKVLGQNEEVKDLVDEAAKELSSVSAVLRQEVADQGSPPGIETTSASSQGSRPVFYDRAAGCSGYPALTVSNFLMAWSHPCRSKRTTRPTFT